jgi:hypothetical protein
VVVASWGFEEAVGGDVEVWGAGGGEVVFEAFLVEGLGFGVREEEGGAGVVLVKLYEHARPEPTG